MSIFGSYAKEDLIYNLERVPDVFWKFKYPTADNEAILERFMRSNPPSTEIFILELSLTFAETNLGLTDNEPAYVTEDMPLGVKQARIGEMPHELIVELARALNDYAENWGALAKEIEK